LLEWHLLSAGQLRGDRVSRVWLLCVKWLGQLYAVHGRLFLQCDGPVGRSGWLQRGLLLSDGVDFSDATDLPSSFVLPGAEPEHDGVARVILLPGERHEHADPVRRGIVLQPDGSERRGRSVQRRVLLRRGLVDCDSVLVRQWHVLPDRQLQHDDMSSRFVLPRARAGELYAESDRQLLQHDGSVGLCVVHGRFVLPDLGFECTDGQLHCRLLLPDGLERGNAGFVSADDILSDRESCDHHMPCVFILCQHGHEHARAVHTGLVLRGRRSVGAERHVHGRLLLRDGLEHGDAKPMHEPYLLS
jgi:hypothetical protein